MQQTMNQPAVIALNGPPGSGKTLISKYLMKVIPDAVRFQTNDALYSVMQEQGSAPQGMLYQDFKLLPESRERLIIASTVLRSEDNHIFDRRVTDSMVFKSSRVVIIDNVGRDAGELEWYDNHSSSSILLRLDTPYNEIEPLKSKARRLRTSWENDFRLPLTHHTMLTAYDSRQMILLLEWLQRPLAREEAGPYYGISQLWTKHFASCEPVGRLCADGRASG